MTKILYDRGMWYVLIAFLSPIFYALSCVIDSYFSNAAFQRTSTLIFFASLTNILVIPFILLFGMPTVPSWETFLVISAVAVINCFYLFPYFIALKHIDTSIVVALFALGQFSIPVLAYFIVDEQMSMIKYIGFAIILLSAITLNLDVKKLKLNVAFWLMLGVSLMLCVADVLNKYALGDVDAVTVLFYQCLITSVIPWFFLLFPKIRTDIIKNVQNYVQNIRYFLANELFSQIGNAATVVALAGLPVLTFESISSSQSIFTLLWGALLYKIFGGRFKESLDVGDIVKKCVSFACISVGIYLVLM